ncbi:MAG: DDE-type integrase/transposase/recombinase [Negativicutes bacterium]
MTEEERNAIAGERYRMIAGVINRATPLEVGENTAWFKEMAQKRWSFPPYWLERSFSIRSFERWKMEYQRKGFDGLKPAVIPKRGTKAIAQELLKSAETIRKSAAVHSVDQIIFMLESTGVMEKGTIHPSTLARHFKRMGLTRRQVASERNHDYGFRRIEAEAPGRLWQSDFHHTLYLPDPLQPEKWRLAKLCAILDDHSRFIVHGQYYWDERMPCLEDTLKKAIEKHGIPEQFYCDNGSAFSAGHIAQVCGRLGIRLSHSRPYKPQGRGKIERFFQFVDSSFKPGAQQEIQTGKLTTLNDLNRAFSAWLEGYYHVRVHGAIKESPSTRMVRFPVKPLPYGKSELRRLFFVEQTRKVDKAGCISLNGATYEVNAELGRMSVQIRYDPFDPADAEVYLAGQSAGKARLMDATRNFHEHNRKRLLTDKPATEPTLERQQDFSMLEAIRKNVDKVRRSEDVLYGEAKA